MMMKARGNWEHCGGDRHQINGRERSSGEESPLEMYCMNEMG